MIIKYNNHLIVTTSGFAITTYFYKCLTKNDNYFCKQILMIRNDNSIIRFIFYDYNKQIVKVVFFNGFFRITYSSDLNFYLSATRFSLLRKIMSKL